MLPSHCPHQAFKLYGDVQRWQWQWKLSWPIRMKLSDAATYEEMLNKMVIQVIIHNIHDRCQRVFQWFAARYAETCSKSSFWQQIKLLAANEKTIKKTPKVIFGRRPLFLATTPPFPKLAANNFLQETQVSAYLAANHWNTLCDVQSMADTIPGTLDEKQKRDRSRWQPKQWVFVMCYELTICTCAHAKCITNRATGTAGSQQEKQNVSMCPDSILDPGLLLYASNVCAAGWQPLWITAISMTSSGSSSITVGTVLIAQRCMAS